MKPTNPLLSSLGYIWEWLIQRWVQYTGRAVKVGNAAWLSGPIGSDKIGAGFYESYADNADLVIQRKADRGLLESFSSLRSAHFAPEKVHPAIVDFYERTAIYTLDAWAQWVGPVSPFVRLMISSVSRNIEQLILPLTPLTTSHGMSSEIITLASKQTGEIAYTGWLRKAVATGDIVYAGFYTTCKPPRYPGRCVKVVFPLPGGSATVILRPMNGPNGSFKLVSDGRKFGGPGSYRLHMVDSETLRVKYVPIKERFHVYVDDEGVLRTDHHFKLWRLPFLTLHYKIAGKEPHA